MQTKPNPNSRHFRTHPCPSVFIRGEELATNSRATSARESAHLRRAICRGNAGEAAERFLDGTFEGTLISFDQSKTAGLSDSIMTTGDGRSVKVSSKGKKGATASAKNLIDSVEELQATKEHLKKYTAPASSKVYYEKHKEEVKRRNLEHYYANKVDKKLPEV